MNKFRSFTFTCLAVLFVGICFGQLRPANLTCEYSVNPLGIDTSNPRLSWKFQSESNDQFQSAYEIIVSDNLTLVQQHEGNAWSSGKVSSASSVLIDYAGIPLKSFTRYYWSVKVYDHDNNTSGWSEPSWFETAMLEQADWKAQWIADGSKQFEREQDFYGDDRMPLFQKEISITKKITSARLYVSGLGYFEGFINGQKIGNNFLDPGWTSYKKSVLYVVHDITSMLKSGRNIAGFMLGNGWWNPLPLKLFGRFNLRDYQQTGRPCLKAEIHIRYDDGSVDIVSSDATWKTAPGPVIRNNVYLGEHYDARLEQSGWINGSMKSDVWKNAVVIEGPWGTMRSQMQPPIRATKVLKAVSVKAIKPGVYIVDMGQNFAGVPRIKVTGKAGTRVVMRYGEALLPDGALNYLTTVAGQIKEVWKVNGGPGAPATAWQEDDYILKGKGAETWNPRFTFHGFRYIEITGWPGTPTIKDIEGLRLNSDIQTVGEFASSNEMFNKIHQATQWTFLSNVFSVQSDCPGREKMGYGADMVVTANAYLYNYDMAGFYNKAVHDFADEQQADGGITEIAPYTGIHDRGLGGDSGPLGWQLGYIYLQKRLYEFYGDKRIIARQYPSVVKQIGFLKQKSVDGLFHWDISDHEALDPKPEALSASAFYYHHVLLAAEFADILGKSNEEAEYRKLALQIKTSIAQKYLVPNTGRFDNATQSAQIFALWYGLTPERDLSMKVLMDEFKRHKMHVSSGIFGVSMMFDLLRTTDQPEVAYAIANQRDFPGWGFMIDKGATTLWESWEYPDNGPSQNHPMFGSIDEWFYRSILGINPAEPAFKKIIIKPQPAGDLKWAKGSFQSMMGPISSDWKIDGDKYQLAVSIPPNTSGEVWIKSKDNGGLKQGGVVYAGKVEYRNGYAVVKVGSGNYKFESSIK